MLVAPAAPTNDPQMLQQLISMIEPHILAGGNSFMLRDRCFEELRSQLTAYFKQGYSRPKLSGIAMRAIQKLAEKKPYTDASVKKVLAAIQACVKEAELEYQGKKINAAALSSLVRPEVRVSGYGYLFTFNADGDIIEANTHIESNSVLIRDDSGQYYEVRFQAGCLDRLRFASTNGPDRFREDKSDFVTTAFRCDGMVVLDSQSIWRLLRGQTSQSNPLLFYKESVGKQYEDYIEYLKSYDNKELFLPKFYADRAGHDWGGGQLHYNKVFVVRIGQENLGFNAQNFGNFLYGAIFAMAGFSEDFILSLADLYEIKMRKHLDSADDRNAMRLGYAYALEHLTDIDDAFPIKRPWGHELKEWRELAQSKHKEDFEKLFASVRESGDVQPYLIDAIENVLSTSPDSSFGTWVYQSATTILNQFGGMNGLIRTYAGSVFKATDETGVDCFDRQHQ